MAYSLYIQGYIANNSSIVNIDFNPIYLHKNIGK
jgi:hypothetical protein